MYMLVIIMLSVGRDGRIMEVFLSALRGCFEITKVPVSQSQRLSTFPCMWAFQGDQIDALTP